MSKFAEKTTVSVEKSKFEIETLLKKYGASKFVSGWNEKEANLAFEAKGRFIKFFLPIPDKNSKEFTHTRMRGWDKKRTPQKSELAWEYVERTGKK